MTAGNVLRMVCCHLYEASEGHEHAFAVDTNAITFGRGCLAEVGERTAALGLKRVAIITDRGVRDLAVLQTVSDAMSSAGVDATVYDEVKVEPSDASFEDAARFATEGRFDGFVSVGGGSVIDTAKAANLYSTYPADLLTYVNAPVGAGQAVPGPLKPHIACPTTSGTGSECTGISIFDLVTRGVKTGIAHRYLRPTEALIDPNATDTLPGFIVAASGFDVLCHALESYTARPFSRRSAQGPRPMSQGANPWSDIGCREALRLAGHHLVRAVRDGDDKEAREKMMWASTLAGIAFGNAGVHIPHGMSYAVAGLAEGYHPPSYPSAKAMVPHGVSVVVNAPAVFRWTASTNPERHLEAAALLGADTVGARGVDSGEILSARLSKMMMDCELPNGISGVGYQEHHVPALSEGAFVQQRLLQNAPRPIDRSDLANLFRDAMTCW